MQEKGLKTSDAAVLGGISGANHVHTYGKSLWNPCNFTYRPCS